MPGPVGQWPPVLASNVLADSLSGGTHGRIVARGQRPAPDKPSQLLRRIFEQRPAPDKPSQLLRRIFEPYRFESDGARVPVSRFTEAPTGGSALLP